MAPFRLLSLLLGWSCLQSVDGFIASSSLGVKSPRVTTSLLSSAQPTELPDSLEDAAQRAAEATKKFVEQSGPMARCRVDFDTSVGDETFSILKTSTEFMQNFVSGCCYAMIPGLQEEKQAEMMRLVQAKSELKDLQKEEEFDEEKAAQLEKVISMGGREEGYKWNGPICRVYFPDEGNAALARRDWLNPESPRVPPCVVFSSCGGVRVDDVKNDRLVFFFCPKASEAEDVEKALQETEEKATDLQMTCFVNPNLVDMGVTGFGMAGRMLRERLIDTLQYTYYLRTLQWGALTRLWPYSYSLWQEDVNADGGYNLIKMLDRLPSNPEVEDIKNEDNQERQSGGFLDQLGDFVNGMMRL
eukprot:scaffold4740_cov165-Amphora_coffeaeformis.AAC.1